MNARKLILLGLLLALAVVVACAPAPTPTPVPTPVPPTAAPKPTTAPAAALDVKVALDKYLAALPDGFGTIQPAAVNDQMKATKVFILDLREASEVAADGYIDGSTVMSVRAFMKNLDKLPAKDQPIVTTCAGGHRGAMGMVALQMLGYTNVKSMAGGIRGWKAANLPVVTGTPPTPAAGKAPEVDKDLSAAFDKYFSAMPDGWSAIQAPAANDQMKATKVTLLDVREPSEFTSGGYIEGSINVSIRSLLKSDKLPADKAAPIIVTCASGHRGGIATLALQLLGYTNVKSIANGLNGWKAANLPVVGGTAPAAAFDLKGAFDKYLAGLPDGFGTIAPAAAKDQMAATKTFLLDVRETGDMASGYIEGTTNIPVRTLFKNLDKLPAKDQPIIVTCASGHRGAFTMAALQMLGYTNVKSMAGGVNAWKAANLPLVTTGTPAAPMAGMAPTVDKDLVAAFDKWFAALPDGFSGIAVATANDQMKATKTFVLDLREASEVTADGSIEGSVVISIRALAKNLDKLPTDKAAPIIVTCKSGHRGAIGMMALQMLGYTNVKSMLGGINAWKTANLPIVR